jgi:aminomethyltransferase
MTDEPIKTPFYDFHVAAGAKMVTFAGFCMPVQYKGIIAEHLAVRRNVGMFDLSHMGELEVTGADALDFLQKVTTNNVAALKVGGIQYSCMTTPSGGIVDDLLVYRLPDRYLLVVNAANTAKDYDWLRAHSFGDVRITDRSAETALLAVQGPKAQAVLQELTEYDLENMPYYTSATAPIADVELLFSRTGYTGEDGFEIYIPLRHSYHLWKALVGAGEKYGMELVGLGARDTLRLEMKMALYGNDIDESTTPLEAGLGWIVHFDKDFIGKEVLARQKEEKPRRRLVCLELEGKAVPRPGYAIYNDNEKVGRVTSGTFSPSLQKPIALGYVPREKAKAGSQVAIEIRGAKHPAVVVKPPFYKHGSHR